MSTATTLGLALAGVAAAEATGVTNFSGSSGSPRTPRTPRLPAAPAGPDVAAIVEAARSGQQGPDVGAIAQAISQAAQSGASGSGSGGPSTVVNVASRAAEQAAEQTRETAEQATDTAKQTTNTGGASGTVADRVRDLAEQGAGDDYDLRTAPGVPDKVRAAAEALKETGTAVQQTRDTSTGFARENPYVVAGTTLGAAGGSIIPGAGTVAGAGLGGAAGSIAEVTADTITGGTPLGVQSPVNNDDDGALWDGGDPFNLRRFTAPNSDREAIEL